jgi:hypothetical protein
MYGIEVEVMGIVWAMLAVRTVLLLPFPARLHLHTPILMLATVLEPSSYKFLTLRIVDNVLYPDAPPIRLERYLILLHVGKNRVDSEHQPFTADVVEHVAILMLGPNLIAWCAVIAVVRRHLNVAVITILTQQNLDNVFSCHITPPRIF